MVNVVFLYGIESLGVWSGWWFVMVSFRGGYVVEKLGGSFGKCDVRILKLLHVFIMKCVLKTHFMF